MEALTTEWSTESTTEPSSGYETTAPSWLTAEYDETEEGTESSESTTVPTDFEDTQEAQPSQNREVRWNQFQSFLVSAGVKSPSSPVDDSVQEFMLDWPKVERRLSLVETTTEELELVTSEVQEATSFETPATTTTLQPVTSPAAVRSAKGLTAQWEEVQRVADIKIKKPAPTIATPEEREEQEGALEQVDVSESQLPTARQPSTKANHGTRVSVVRSISGAEVKAAVAVGRNIEGFPTFPSLLLAPSDVGKENHSKNSRFGALTRSAAIRQAVPSGSQWLYGPIGKGTPLVLSGFSFLDSTFTHLPTIYQLVIQFLSDEVICYYPLKWILWSIFNWKNHRQYYFYGFDPILGKNFFSANYLMLAGVPEFIIVSLLNFTFFTLLNKISSNQIYLA